MLNVIGDMRERLENEVSTLAYVNIPENRPKEFVVVSRGGGAWENDLIDRAGVNIYTYSQTEAGAYELMQRVCECIRALPFTAGYCTATMEEMRSDYDLTAKEYRWYSSWTIKNYEPKE